MKHSLITIAALTLGLGGFAHASYVNEAGKAPYYTTIPEGMAAAKAQKSALAIKYYTDW